MLALSLWAAVVGAVQPDSDWTMGRLRRLIGARGLTIKTTGKGRTKATVLADIISAPAGEEEDEDDEDDEDDEEEGEEEADEAALPGMS